MYEAFHGLTSRPFPSVPSTESYFPAELIEHARQTLIRAVERAQGPALLIGPSGTGKSLLLSMLEQHFRSRFQVITLANTRLCSRRALLQNLLFELKLPYRDMEEGELRLSLIDFLEPSETCPHGLLLLVDEAHTLPVQLLEELRMITNLVRDDQPRVRLILAGGARLEERLADPTLDSLNQRVAARCYLEPLNSDETRTYVAHQIATAGGNPANTFDDDALSAIASATSGIPRLINQVADHALILAAAYEQTPIDRAGIEEAWADLQQLPAPMQTNEDSQSSHVIEFGTLDDDAADFDEPNPVHSVSDSADEGSDAGIDDEEGCLTEGRCESTPVENYQDVEPPLESCQVIPSNTEEAAASPQDSLLASSEPAGVRFQDNADDDQAQFASAAANTSAAEIDAERRDSCKTEPQGITEQGEVVPQESGDGQTPVPCIVVSDGSVDLDPVDLDEAAETPPMDAADSHPLSETTFPEADQEEHVDEVAHSEEQFIPAAITEVDTHEAALPAPEVPPIQISTEPVVNASEFSSSIRSEAVFGTFQDEELVLERFGSFNQQIWNDRPKVRSEESRDLANALQPPLSVAFDEEEQEVEEGQPGEVEGQPADLEEEGVAFECDDSSRSSEDEIDASDASDERMSAGDVVACNEPIAADENRADTDLPSEQERVEAEHVEFEEIDPASLERVEAGMQEALQSSVESDEVEALAQQVAEYLVEMPSFRPPESDAEQEDVCSPCLDEVTGPGWGEWIQEAVALDEDGELQIELLDDAVLPMEWNNIALESLNPNLVLPPLENGRAESGGTESGGTENGDKFPESGRNPEAAVEPGSTADECARRASVPLWETTTEQEAGRIDDRDLIVVEEDAFQARSRSAPAGRAHRQEYRRLFGKLRRED